ncbi:MAG: molecular chaperone DnaK, partial [Anaerolineae bacterium]|nr:molecular chaperone DnaK [Anaerolineae bacterium]
AYSVERSLEELGDKVSAGDRQGIELLITEVRTAVKGEDANAIRSAMEQLQQASYRLSEQAYGQPGANGTNGTNGAGYTNGHGQPGGSAAGDEDVVEGEFRTV